jgi:hypothetical protein
LQEGKNSINFIVWNFIRIIGMNRSRKIRLVEHVNLWARLIINVKFGSEDRREETNWKI